jgi:hypothetical protein
MTTCNVAHFLSTPETNELYYDRVQKYLQPDYVAKNVRAGSADDFAEVTQFSRSQWHLLVTDPTRLANDLPIIKAFATAQPSCSIAVIGSGAVQHPELPPLKCWPTPPSLDDWLSMMHQLIAAAR